MGALLPVGTPEARRGLVLLAAGFALAWVSISMVAGPGSATYVALSGRPQDAGMFFALFSLGAAAGALLGGRLMDRIGRRPVLAGAHVLAASGYAVAAAGVVWAHLASFVLGTILLAVATGTTYLTRLGAAEMFPVAVRGRAVAVVQVSATAGALVGPTLLMLSGPIAGVLGRDPLTLVWFVAPPLLLVAASLVLVAPEPRLIAAAIDQADHARGLASPSATAATPRGEASAIAPPAPPRRPFRAAVVGLVVAQAAMVAVMAVAGAAVLRGGNGSAAMGAVMMLHFVGMFALSLLVGRVADRRGRRNTMLTGFSILAAGGLAIALVPGILGLALGLLLVGLGWSFAYIGATVLVTDVVPVTQRARTLGTIDLVASLSAAGLAFAGGHWFAAQGIEGLGLAAAAILLVPVAFLLALREVRPGVYTGGAAVLDAAPEAIRR